MAAANIPRRRREVTAASNRHRGERVARVAFWSSDGRKHVLRFRTTQGTKAAADDAATALANFIREVGADRYIELRRAAADPYDVRELSAAHDAQRVTDVAAARPTLGRLIDEYRADDVKPPVSRRGKMIEGMKSWRTVESRLRVIEEHFGRGLALEELTFDRIRQFKIDRLKTPIKRSAAAKERERSTADVNRTLAILRHLIKIAMRKEWMLRNPFDFATSKREKLIEKEDLTRERIISPDEERRILGKLRDSSPAIQTLIVALLDTGARVGEFVPVVAPQPRRRGSSPESAIRKGRQRREYESDEAYDSRLQERQALEQQYRRVTWGDVDFDAGVVTIRASKTQTERVVGLTPRLRTAFERLRGTLSPAERAAIAPVFGALPYSAVRSAWLSACDAAKVDRIGLHQLRHTRATRWIQGGLNETEVAHLLGHSKKSNVTRRYVNPDERTIERALAADARFIREHSTKRKSRPDEAVN